MDASHGHRSSSVSAMPAAIFSTFEAAWWSSASMNDAPQAVRELLRRRSTSRAGDAHHDDAARSAHPTHAPGSPKYRHGVRETEVRDDGREPREVPRDPAHLDVAADDVAEHAAEELVAGHRQDRPRVGSMPTKPASWPISDRSSS